MYLRIKGGRSCFYQWDSGQTVIVEHEGTIHEVHFAHKDDERSLTVITKEIENGVEANVPNILLQSSEDIFAYLVFRDEDGTETRKSVRIPVLSRPKPETYVYTESEVLNYAYLDERLKELEGEGLANAVADYLEKNPPKAGATATEAAQIQQNKTDIETLTREKLNASALPEAVNEALAQAKASGEFKGEPGKTPEKGKDYFTPAEVQAIAELAADMVEIPEGGNVDLTGYATEEWVGKNYQPKGNYLTEVPNDYAKKSELPTKVSQLENDNGYLTEHQDLSGYAKTTDIPTDDHINGLIDTAIDNLEIPEGGSNQPLIFTGAVNATYDGSEVVTVNIPSGGGGGTGGGSTEWEVLVDTTLEEDTTFTLNNLGDDVKEAFVAFAVPARPDDDENSFSSAQTVLGINLNGVPIKKKDKGTLVFVHAWKIGKNSYGSVQYGNTTNTTPNFSTTTTGSSVSYRATANGGATSNIIIGRALPVGAIVYIAVRR